MPVSRVLTVLRDLLLAMLNATLILLAICLWLAWRLTSEVDDVARTVTENLQPLQPLREDISTLTDEVAGLRADLAAAGDRVAGAAPASAALTRLATRAEALNARLAGLGERADAIAADPDQVFAQAAATAAAALGTELQQLAGCRAPG